MFRKTILMSMWIFLLTLTTASAQVCPLNGSTSKKLVCLIPQVYGPFSLGFDPTKQDPTQSVLFTGDHHAAHFDADFLATFAPINQAVGMQVSQLPIASPSSGITFTFDKVTKLETPTTDESLGPILGERAGTIGRRRLFLGFSYQYFNFSSIDGQNINNIPTVLQHQRFPPPFPSPSIVACPVQTGLTGTKYDGDPCFVRDFIQTTNNIDLKVNQYTIYVTYGITRHLDFSAAIPFLNVQMNVTSNATIVPNTATPAAVGAPGNVWHSFNALNPALASQCASTVPCLQASFSDSGRATGIGDVVLRGKYTVHQWERAGFALGLDVRLPTGDETNFLGSGAVGVKPFGVFSYKARVSPHAEVGYEVNGDSTLAGNNLVPPAPSTVTKGSLPNRFIYIVGADVTVSKRLTGAFDIYGQRLFGAPEFVSQPYQDHGNCSGATNADAVNCAVYTPGTTHPDIAQKTADVNITNASLGLKFRVFKQLVLTGNVLLKLDDGGLRSRAVPLVGVSYSF
jgi:Putative MetA-pathway of phenol degradation